MVTGEAVEDFANPPSGGTGVNIARSGFSAAVRSLDAAVDRYAAALAQPPATCGPLLEFAGRQRNIAIATWSTAADVAGAVTGGHRGGRHVLTPRNRRARRVRGDLSPDPTGAVGCGPSATRPKLSVNG